MVGVDIARVRSHGWKATTVADATVARVEIRCLEAAITAFRDAEPHFGRGAAA